MPTMKITNTIQSGLSVIERYHYKWVLFITCSWTIVDIFYWVYYMHLPANIKDDPIFSIYSSGAVMLRIVIVFFMSWLMGYLLIINLRQRLRHMPLLVNLLIKTALLLLASFVMNFLLHFTYSVFILQLGVVHAIRTFYDHSNFIFWLLKHSVGWLALFIGTQILMELNEKYSPGVFLDILMGRYLQPRVEKRIVIFLDLTNSTPIAEQLGNKQYFRFIRDFIYYISVAVLEYNGSIYQYVGDEIVVYWKANKKNARKCIHALLMAKRLINRNTGQFKRRYGVVPEFKVGIHVGEVTVGEIGIIKKDIAMSGDTMNTAARIRTACTELNYNIIASKDFVEIADVFWQHQPLGLFDLKGKTNSVDLYAIMI
jgi:adenylate cyclase